MRFPKKFTVHVKPNSSNDEFNGLDHRGRYLIHLKEKAEDNKANIALIKFFKKKFNINIRILMGLKRRDKIVELVELA
ncbi:DUF167 domain-containing protein [Candidatus Woesearchaeota archaeon]|nr:DUF167 domain-containing protein [Candidatus Woesearchaeota archaeon]